jgi:hypothetical protein
MSNNDHHVPHDAIACILDDDDANGILDALACLDDFHPTGQKPAVGLLSDGVTYGPVVAVPPPSNNNVALSQQQQQQTQESKKPCHPYFYYRDFSTLPDPDPATPITAPGRIPNFPAKMYAILSRKDLCDIITWLPHGRSWKVLKPREFEVKVIPTYFEHSKFSSFIRQANGWGFRRIISKGGDRNSYYHELFLRGKPHLIKLMRRPPPSSKPLADATTEPDFHAISAERPLPEIKDGDAATDAVASGNFPRQATYSFIPPQISSAAPAAAAATTKVAPGPAVQAPPPSQQQQPTMQYNPAPVASAPLANTGYQSLQQQQHHHSVYQHQQPEYHYHAPPPPAQQQDQHQQQQHELLAEPILSATNTLPSIHPVESTDSLLDLLSRPLPPAEMYGSHSFIPLFD